MDILPNQVTAVVLGIMQDGGLPHIGCRCRRCQAAYDDPRRADYAASLAIVDTREKAPRVWLLDATPDIKYQLNLLAGVLGPHPSRSDRLRQPDGIFLTHAHMGHISGLPELGPEAMGVIGLPVYAAGGLISLLVENKLWQPLLSNLELRPLHPNHSIQLAPELSLTPIPVPHRDEWGVGTFAFRIEGPSRALLYLPDIDAWEQWPQARRTLAAVDVALVDASFFSMDELGGRPPVAHTLVPHTLTTLADLPCQLLFTHLNHTNPALDTGSDERTAVTNADARIACSGQTILL
jgi:pyrroloquinoline quinone biosynthesis protein B